MNLDWNFYYDDWLIDKVPDGVKIKIVETADGLECRPKSLTCYFGANPIYLYGVGKLFHESLMSPTGIVIYPEFLSRPGFEWVNRETFNIRFTKPYDFHGVEVVTKHIGMVNATKYLQDISKTMYGIEPGSYANIQTPSSKVRKMSGVDLALMEAGVTSKQVFTGVPDLVQQGGVLYSRMHMENGATGPIDLVSGNEMTIVSPGAPILSPGIFTQVLFLKYSHIILPPSVSNMFATKAWTILFKTNQNFREGKIIDIGAAATRTTHGVNVGFALEIFVDNITVLMNDGQLRMFQFRETIDYRFAHSFLLSSDGEYLSLSVDGVLIGSLSVSGVGKVLMPTSTEYYISKNVVSGHPSFAGDIEELAMFTGNLSGDTIDSYFDGGKPLLKYGGASQLIEENIPAALSYGLTYVKPTDIYIPNNFHADFFKVYLKNAQDEILIAGFEDGFENSSYRDDLEPYEDKSIILPDGFHVHQVLAQELKEEIPVLTKLTSDVHIPLRIHMDFIVPNHFYKKDITFDMRLVLKSLDSFLWYSFQKFKTGEFV